jgi:hypothetical protein
LLEELLKLSKELLDMELTKESLEIDAMIHRLYGMASIASIDHKEFDQEASSNSYEQSLSSLEEVKEIIAGNRYNEEFKYGVANVLIESMSSEDLESIRETLEEYLD